MATIRNTKLETADARRTKLTPRPKPYFITLAPGIALGYRRRTTNKAGRWCVRHTGPGFDKVQKLGIADDYEPAMPPTVLGFHDACAAARNLARGDVGVVATDAPVTVEGMVTGYVADLKRRKSKPGNATRLGHHLEGTPLWSRHVALLTTKELVGWMDGLLAKGLSPDTVNRTRNCFMRAYNVAASHDRRIRNQKDVQEGLAAVAGGGKSRNVILNDTCVRAFIAESHRTDAAFGVLVRVLADTGARPSQAARLRVCDFIDHPTSPCLRMPVSFKGNVKRRKDIADKKTAVAITLACAARLRDVVKGRKPTDLLLLQADGQSWRVEDENGEADAHRAYRAYLSPVVAALIEAGHIVPAELPAPVTLYALRHSSIVRQLIKGYNTAIVAKLHNTSVEKIESNYADHITDHLDDLVRPSLLEGDGSVVTLRRAA